MALFDGASLESIARALGDTEHGLKGSEIEQLLLESKIQDPGAITKWRRLHDAFQESQRQRGDHICVLAFIRKAMKPAKYIRAPEKFETLRGNLNTALAFCGYSVGADRQLSTTSAAKTISEAQKRADDLRAGLIRRGVHPDVIVFCKAELTADNYFHAVLQATKSVSAKIRARIGSTLDGADLVDAAFSGQLPKLAINSLSSDSQRSEQKGFGNLLKGTFGMFRNPTAHEARVNWAMSKEDAEDLLSLVSLIHRRLDKAV